MPPKKMPGLPYAAVCHQHAMPGLGRSSQWPLEIRDVTLGGGSYDPAVYVPPAKSFKFDNDSWGYTPTLTRQVIDVMSNFANAEVEAADVIMHSDAPEIDLNAADIPADTWDRIMQHNNEVLAATRRANDWLTVYHRMAGLRIDEINKRRDS